MGPTTSTVAHNNDSYNSSRYDQIGSNYFESEREKQRYLIDFQRNRVTFKDSFTFKQKAAVR